MLAEFMLGEDYLYSEFSAVLHTGWTRMDLDGHGPGWIRTDHLIINASSSPSDKSYFIKSFDAGL